MTHPRRRTPVPALRPRARRLRAALTALVLATAATACADSVLEPVPLVDEQDAMMARKRSTGTASVLAGAVLYVDPYSSAGQQAELWRLERPADAAQMDKIAAQAQAQWLGEWSGDVRVAVDRTVTAAASAGTVPVLVAYNIPQRDCGGLSGGGGATADAYRNWIQSLASGIGRRTAVVVLEPDALAAMDCLSATDQQTRVDLIRYAVQTLKANARTAVYIDAGHARWHSPEVAADRLRRADVAAADGFALNVSNFLTDAANEDYGDRVSKLIGGKHFVIDSSRNGRGPTADYQWCNPEDRALGRAPSTSGGHPLVDAYLWIKRPGESDGACNGGPSAGSWWADYALGLAQRAAW